MQMQLNIQGGDFANAGSASSQVKRLLGRLNIPQDLIRRTVVALYEAEVNVVAHAFNGVIMVDVNPDRIHIEVGDTGPGIPDINQAMERGYSTASPMVREMGFGAGMGLPNIKKNMDKMDIRSVVDQGTNLTMTNYIKNN